MFRWGDLEPSALEWGLRVCRSAGLCQSVYLCVHMYVCVQVCVCVLCFVGSCTYVHVGLCEGVYKACVELVCL